MSNNRLISALATWQSWGAADKAPKLEDLQPLAGGLTNEGYLLTLNNKKYVLRLAAANSDSLNINRKAELALHQFLSNQNLNNHRLAAKIIYAAEDSSFWLREYLVGKPINPAKQATNKLELAIQVAKHLQFIHQLEVPTNLAKQLTQVNIEEKATAYWQAIHLQELPQQEITALKQLQAQLNKLNQKLLATHQLDKPSLCHLDPTLGNWLITPNQELHLLDWEYAGLGNPLWDYAQISEELKLNEQEEKELLTALGIKNTPAWLLAKLEMSYLNRLWFAVQKTR